ncbi:MAG: UUP1 family membrane protein [Syntrophales bacterium]
MRRPVFLLVAVLFLATAALILYRIFRLDYPALPVAREQTWQLIVNVYLTPKDEECLLALALPLEHAGNAVVEERIFSGPYGFAIRREGPNRVGVWTGTGIRESEEITYRAAIHARPRRAAPTQSPLLGPYPPAIGDGERRLAQEAAAPWRSLAPAPRLRAVAAFLAGEPAEGPSADAARGRWREAQAKLSRLDAALALLRAADLPARPVEGLLLTAEVHTRTVHWVEVWAGRRWTNLNPETGEVYPEATALLPLAVGGLPAAAVRGAEIADIRWALSRQVVSQWKLLYERIARSGHFLDRWSLLQLPPEFQGTFRILLLVPIGALIISLMRNVVGLPTFGIFMPMLIALAFRNTGWLYGIAIFGGVLAVGFAVRSFLDRLHLLLIPRLSVILTLVVACFTVLALVGSKWGMREFMAVGLIPFVILTMTIERFFILVEESGSREALITAAGSIAVAIAAYGIIGWETLQLTFFIYPELILSVAALQILLGRYRGYRLSELFRFRNLRETP